MITEQHKEALAAIKELKGEKIGASMVLELVDLIEALDANLEAFAAKATEIARAADRSALDVARWREGLMHVGVGNYNGAQRFSFNHMEPGANLMKGSVAGHFTVAIDKARAERSASNEVTP